VTDQQADDPTPAALADIIRAGGLAMADPELADEVRGTGWARPA